MARPQIADGSRPPRAGGKRSITRHPSVSTSRMPGPRRVKPNVLRVISDATGGIRGGHHQSRREAMSPGHTTGGMELAPDGP